MVAEPAQAVLRESGQVRRAPDHVAVAISHVVDPRRKLVARVDPEMGEVQPGAILGTHDELHLAPPAALSIATPEDLRAAPGTSGPAPPGTSLRILDKDGNELPPGEDGEIYVANEMLLEGYTGGESEETVDGHMSTGDLGHLDEEGQAVREGPRRRHESSRAARTSIRKRSSRPSSSTRASRRRPWSASRTRTSERLTAYVVSEGQASEDDLKSHVKDNLAKYKVPREIEFVDELPRNPRGRVDKQQLEDESGDDFR
jgi:acyl-CoA synthetase (AMP-forming)/AMP-acid ligase II